MDDLRKLFFIFVFGNLGLLDLTHNNFAEGNHSSGFLGTVPAHSAAR